MMEALTLYTSSDKCVCASTDFQAAALGKMILNDKPEPEGYRMRCLWECLLSLSPFAAVSVRAEVLLRPDDHR